MISSRSLSSWSSRAAAVRSEIFSPAASSLIQAICRRSITAYFWRPSSVSPMSGERPPGQRHRAEHLPPGRGELFLRGELVAGGEHLPVGAEERQHDVGRSVTFERPSHDRSLSFW